MVDAKKRVLIIGGGVAGMAAARTLHRLGLQAHLVEKSDRLGGNAVKWACMATDQCKNCGACLGVEMKEHTRPHTGIQIHLNTELTAIDVRENGYRVACNGATRNKLDVDGVILATGMTPFDPAVIESLQYGRHPCIITTADLNHLLQTETLTELLEQQTSPSVAFIQCVGSRNRTLGKDYCSQVCCKVALRQADKLRRILPQADLTICHIDLQLIGKELRSQSKDLMDRITLLQGVPGEIRIDADTDRILTVHEDPLSGQRIARRFDLIVLSVGMRPSDGIQSLVAPLGVPFDDWGFVSGEAPLPPRIQVAGAGKFPTDIVSACQQGISAAHRLTADLGALPPVADNKTIAVFGNGREGRRVARAVRAAGYVVVLLDTGPAADAGPEAYELIPEASLTAISRRAGAYQIQAYSQERKIERRAAALVIADGVRRESIEALAPVVSLTALEKTLVADWEQIPPRVAFWLDHSGPEHKTQFIRAMESAIDLTASGRQVWVVMEKVLVHGPGGQRLYDRARRQGVGFVRAVDAADVRITRGKNGVQIDLKEASLGAMDVSIVCDLVVASDRVLPGPRTRRIAQLLGEPLDCEGFAQWANSRHRPIGSRKPGVYYLGSCHDENDAGDLDGEIEALLCELACMDQPAAEIDEKAKIDANLCARCLTCFRTCPHGAVEITRAYQPEIQTNDCIGCGRCVAQCPARAIEMTAMGSEAALQSQTVVYACRRSGHLAAENALATGLIEPDENVAIIPVPCGNASIGAGELIKPLLLGARRVVVAACHDGNCRSSEKGGGAVQWLRTQAPAMGLDPEDIRWHAIAANEPIQIKRALTIEKNTLEGVNHGSSAT